MDTRIVRNLFKEKFGTEGMLYFSPGRINLIGEHTDYNGGCVLPGAIDKGILAEIKPNGTDKVRAYSADLQAYAEFGLNEEDKPEASWAHYIFGVCREMLKRGAQIKGFDTVFSGDVPLGAGLSSSAALESTFAFALNEIYKAGFDNIVALEEALGNPHRKIRSVHVAGTNGKGSVSHMVASTLTAAGYRTGLFTSPHLKDFRERIRIDGRMISEEEVIGFVERNRGTIDRVQPSFFEITTAIAFDCFARHEVDVAVVEVGMGGRLDSTNIIRPLVSVITNIGYDHTQFLGDTLEEIAGEKAGIIKEDTPVVVGESRIETQLVFIDKAKASRAPILFADQTYRVLGQISRPQGQSFEIENRLDGSRFRIDSDLPGLYQRKNVLTALTALDVLNGAGGLSISREQVFRGIATAARTTGLMGRWQQLGERPLVVCDTGHNEAGITEVAAQLAAQHYRKLLMVVGFVEDKDLSKVLPLLPKDAYYFFTRAAIRRALDEKELARRAGAYGLRGECVGSVSEALRLARSQAGPEDLIFVGGSTYVVAEII